MCEIQYAIENINNTIEQAEERIYEFKDKNFDIIQSKENQKIIIIMKEGRKPT